MARVFVSASEQYLLLTSPVLTAEPITFAAWYRPATTSFSYDAVMSIVGDSSGEMVLSREGTDLRVFKNGGGVAQNIDTLTANTWHHVCGVFAATNDRRVYTDGGNKITNSANQTGGTFTRTGIGARPRVATPLEYLDGRVAEAAIWSAALSDAEVAFLALGFSPLFIQPHNLAAYWPLIRDDDNDLIGGFDLTPINSPTVSIHPPLIKYPTFKHSNRILSPTEIASNTISNIYWFN